MRKTLSLLIALLLCRFALSAQPRSFGVRFSTGLEMSYQHAFGATANGPSFLEVDAGVLGYTDFPGYRISGIYDFTLYRLETGAGVLDVFSGPGLCLGMYDKSRFLAGALLQAGASWRFSAFPLMVGVDVRPCLAFASGDFAFPVREAIPMVSLRWAF